jgi:hypothetical protein
MRLPAFREPGWRQGLARPAVSVLLALPQLEDSHAIG